MATTDIFEDGKYRINKQLLSLTGLWPYEPSNIKLPRQIFIICGCFFIILPQSIAVTREFNIDNLLEILPTLCGSTICLMKALILIFHSNKLKILYKKIQNDWECLSSNQELLILQKYAETGRKITLIYSAGVVITIIAFFLLPFYAPLLDFIAPLNESRPKFMVYSGEFFLNQEKYFFTCMFIQFVGLFSCVFIAIGTDTLHMIFVQHNCGIFQILGYRLRNFQYKEKQNYWTSKSGDTKYENNIDFHVKECIELHLKAIKFNESVEIIFNVIFFIDIGIGIILQAGSSVGVVFKMGYPVEQVRCGIIAMIQIFRVFINSLPGQLIIDHSSNVVNDVYCGLWYNIPVKTRKMLIPLMVRSQRQCQLTTAKIYVLNFPNFSKVVRTSMSYCTVMASYKSRDI